VPFTPSHAVVALPFVRTPLVPAAIAVGAMAPDLPMFLRGTPLSYQMTHTAPAVSVLVAAALLAVWWWVLRPAVRELLPSRLAERMPGEWDATGAAVATGIAASRHPSLRAPAAAVTIVAWTLLSLALGVLSHIAWDAFTHEGRWGVALVPTLERPWGPLPGYKWLQYGSGVLGLVVLAVAGLAWLRGRRRKAVVHVLPAGVRIAWWGSLPAVLAVAWLGGLAIHGPLTSNWTAVHLAYRVLPPACAVWAVATLALCVTAQVLRRRAR
jgi:hypothetical protein